MEDQDIVDIAEDRELPTGWNDNWLSEDGLEPTEKSFLEFRFSNGTWRLSQKANWRSRATLWLLGFNKK